MCDQEHFFFRLFSPCVYSAFMNLYQSCTQIASAFSCQLSSAKQSQATVASFRVTADPDNHAHSSGVHLLRVDGCKAQGSHLDGVGNVGPNQPARPRCGRPPAKIYHTPAGCLEDFWLNPKRFTIRRMDSLSGYRARALALAKHLIICFTGGRGFRKNPR